MDNTILTALIAAGSACIGALIPSLFSYLGKRREYKNDRKAKLEEIRRKEYYQYIEALQNMVNDGNRDNFLSLQVSTNRLLLFAGPELSKLVNQYYNYVIDKTLRMESLTLEEQTKYQTDIFNAMRGELGVSKKDLENVSLVRAGFN